MIPIRFQFFLGILLALTAACDRNPSASWTAAIPASATVVIIPAEHPNLQTLLRRDYIQWLDQLTPARVSDVQAVDFFKMGIKKAEAIAIIPISATQWAPLWILSAPIGTLEAKGLQFDRDIASSKYDYLRETIYTYAIGDVTLHAAQIRQVLIVSVNSTSVEEAIRTFKQESLSFPMEGSPEPGSIHVQTALLHRLLGLETIVDVQSDLQAVFTGLRPVHLTVQNPDRAVGELSYLPDMLSPLLRNLTSESSISDLDLYVPRDAVVYAQLNGKSVADPSDPLLSTLNQGLSPHFGYVRIPITTNSMGDEGVYVRLLAESQSVEQILFDLVARGDLIPERDMYRVQNPSILTLISSDMTSEGTYYLKHLRNAIYLSERHGVISRIVADQARDRVIESDEAYQSFRSHFPESVTGFVFVRSDGLVRQFGQWLHPTHRVDRYINRFDVLAMSFSASGENTSTLSFRMFNIDESRKPIVDGWSTNLDGFSISGPATLDDITGDGQADVVVATSGGRLYGFGSDGVELFSTAIGSDGVQGSPIITDWFRNGEKTILVGAANGVYGWSSNGVALPSFPIMLDNWLSAPILVTDVQGRGLASFVVSTTDQSIAILDRRGRPESGWPQRMRDISTTRPVYARIWGQRMILTYADDGIYAWTLNGRVVPGFPIKLPSPGTGELLLTDEHVHIGTIDGDIISIGKTGYFTHVRYHDLTAGFVYQRMPTASTSLRLAGRVGESIVGVGQQGEVRVLDLFGKLVYSDEIFVTMNPTTPMLLDLNRDGHLDLVAGSTYGRVYAWDIRNRAKLDILPAYTSYDPAFSTNFGNDDVPYMVSDSPDGIRVWRIQGDVSEATVSAPEPRP
jgi:hypothetical protein